MRLDQIQAATGAPEECLLFDTGGHSRYTATALLQELRERSQQPLEEHRA